MVDRPLLEGWRLHIARIALLLGNFLVGIGVLGPAAMLVELAEGLEVSIRDAGLLIAFGAIVIAVGSPLTAWLTGRMERRTLLLGSLLALTLGHAASAFAPNYATLLAVRVVMLAAAAIYTPQAASTVAQLVSVKDRSTSIAFVFLGWPLAMSAGLPMVAYLTSQFGWRPTFAVFAVVGAGCSLLMAVGLPPRLRGEAVSLATWALLARNRLVVLLLLLTSMQVVGQFVVFPYIGPLLAQLGGASPNVIATCFAIYGIAGFIGSVVATRMVRPLGAFLTSVIFLSGMLLGTLLWAFGAGSLVLMALGLGLWGLGLAATNSMQQARLVAAAPAFGGASVALNTSSIYVGQAAGSALGGLLFERGMMNAIGYVAVAFLAAALLVLLTTRRER